MNAFDNGIVMPQKIAAGLGMKPAELKRHMIESKATGFMDLLTPPALEIQKETIELQGEQAEKLADKQASLQPSTSTSTPTGDNGSSGKRGRPRKPDSEISEEGAQTRTEGTNIGRGGVE